MRFLITALCAFVPVFLSGSFADSETKENMIEDLQSIKNIFRVHYAPAEWKKSYANWDLDEEFESAKKAILNEESLSLKNYQRIVRKFFKSTKDYHVGVNFWSTERSTLPFTVKGANGKYFITHIDYTKLSPTVFTLHVGDELVEFDGNPITEVIRDLKENEEGNANEMTDYALAEMTLTQRVGTFGHIVPNGPITIKVRSKTTGNLFSYQLIWDHHPEKILSPPLKKGIVADNSLFHKKMEVPFYQTLSKLENVASELGARKSFFPKLGKIWWKSCKESYFHAYLFETEDRKLIGYIRIPSYRGGLKKVKEFAEILQFFEERSDALVIDQMSNPGGSVFYLYALASMLTDQPLKAPRHRMTITQEEVAFAVYMMPVLERIQTDQEAQEFFGETLEGNPVTYQMIHFFLNFCRFIVSEWNAGRTYTAPCYLYGIDHINPHPTIRYTKPILLLINHLDFSGGDFFPAIMQDNNRVTTFGTRTAGAGGYVTGTSFPNKFGIASFHYTASLAERVVDRAPIENLGVEPDIDYEVTEDDLKNNYQGFIKAIHHALKDLCKKGENS